VDLSDENIQISEVEGIQAYHNYPIKGHFECSNPQLNQLYKNATSTLLGTVNQFPLSNPHSEMYPWTGDVSLFFTALDRMAKMESFWIKWLRDIKDSQKEDGSIPETVPNFRKISYGAEPAWAQDYVNLVLGLFYRTGDYSILENHFGSIKRLLDYYQSTYKEGSLPAYWGDHKQPTDGETVMKERGKTKELLDYISQAYYYKLLQDFVEICEILNRHKIKGKYIERAHEIKSEFNKHYWDVSKHNYTVRGLPPKNFDNTQTIHAIALQTGIVPDALIQSVYDLLIENIEAHHNKITTGIHGIRALFDVLISFGNKKRMHAIVMDAEYPGWMYQISQGATSLWQGFSGDVVCPPIIRTFYRPVIE
jgi:alpha-L-rhamnosidase